MNLSAVVSVLKNFAPLNLAEKWDNVGLLVEPSSGGSTTIERILLTNDLTEDVMEEALQKKSQLILSYHPPIFSPLKQLTMSNAKQRIIVKAIENRIAIYSPHTAFDSVQGGVNDWIANAVLSLGQGTSSPLQPYEAPAPHKVVIFIPEDKANEMREELSKVGAGVIGNYNQCTFGVLGEGTFFGNENANPAVGTKGGLERVKELRMETVVGKDKLAAVAETIKRVHPYEEPAWETYALQSTVSSNTGQGRLIQLNEKVGLSDLISKVKETFGLTHVKVATPNNKPISNIHIKSVATCAGAGATVLAGVRADVYLTGEMRHHEILDATAKGISVILCDHSNTERGFLKVFKQKLAEKLGGKVAVEVSEVDADPLIVV
eukprot:Phypoly_transcript_10623.p1 GENE.Phypoly_transcript_10623~~Phypoly_transcript_10623.p1  ORF type:complete len:425 (+),score=72.70 Phypoly_transcript_10623:147-1277(+)